MATIETRTDSTGKKTYRVKVRIKGHPPETKTFDQRSVAKNWGQQREADIKRGLAFKDYHAKHNTLSNLIDKYTTEVLPHKPKLAPTRKKHLQWWKQELGAYMLSAIDAEKLNAAKAKLRVTKAYRKETNFAPATINRYLASLADVLSYAVRELGWLQLNPMRMVSKLPEENERVRVLLPEERAALLQACKQSKSPWLYPVVLLALSTGARKMEIMNVRWPEVDFDKQVIRLLETKNKTKRAIPLTGLAYKVLQNLHKQRRKDTDFVFPREDGKAPIELKKHWESAIQLADIKDFRFHDLRHTAASYLLEHGATLPELSAILGHKDVQMIKRYAHLSEQHSVAVAERMTKGVFGDDD